MYTLILFGVLALASILILTFSKEYNTGSVIGGIGTFLFGLVFVIQVAWIFPGRADSASWIAGFKAAKESIEGSRAPYDSYENFALQQQITEWNANLAKEQYWARSHWQDIWYSREVLDLKPIK